MVKSMNIFDRSEEGPFSGDVMNVTSALPELFDIALSARAEIIGVPEDQVSSKVVGVIHTVADLINIAGEEKVRKLFSHFHMGHSFEAISKGVLECAPRGTAAFELMDAVNGQVVRVQYKTNKSAVRILVAEVPEVKEYLVSLDLDIRTKRDLEIWWEGFKKGHLREITQFKNN